MRINLKRWMALAVVAAACLGQVTHAGPPPVSAGDVQAGGPPPNPADLIRTVASSTTSKPEKAIACKQLAVWGDKAAVAPLAALLADPELNSWARIPLEAITDPAADDALRDAAGKLAGRNLVGVINSIGVRRDAKAVAALVGKLGDGDEEVATAAAFSLGKIGGDEAAGAVQKRLTGGSPALRSAAAEACVLIAEQRLAAGKGEPAAALYDAVRNTADLPKARLLEATRGAILARGGAAGTPLLVEQLRSPDREVFRIALRTARELQGPAVADAIIAELGRATPDRQSLLILALADRPADAAKVLPVVTEAAKSGAQGVRATAAAVLETLGNINSVPVLLEGASSDDAELVTAATASLVRLRGADIDADLLNRLKTASGKPRKVLIGLAEQRQIKGSMDEFVKAVSDADPAVRSAALDAIGANGDDKQVPQLLQLLAKAPEADRDALEKAIRSISGRWGPAVLPHILPLAKAGDPHMRIAAIHALSGAGGAEALAAVAAATGDADETVADEAVRTLSTWPNRWPEDTAVLAPLLKLANDGKKPAHKVLAVRGYLQFAQGTKKQPEGERLKAVNAVMPLITRAEERRQAVSALTAIGSGGALDALVKLADDAAIADEAASAIVTVASKGNRGIPAARRKAALQAAVEKAKSPEIKQRAEATLKGVR